MGFQANINKITKLDKRFKPSFYSHSTPEEIQDKIQNGTNTPEELELYKNYTNKLRKGYNSIRPITENPLDNL